MTEMIMVKFWWLIITFTLSNADISVKLGSLYERHLEVAGSMQ